MEENSNASSAASDGQRTPTKMSSPPTFTDLASTTLPVGNYSNGNLEEEKSVTQETGGAGAPPTTTTEVICS